MKQFRNTNNLHIKNRGGKEFKIFELVKMFGKVNHRNMKMLMTTVFFFGIAWFFSNFCSSHEQQLVPCCLESH